MKFNNNTTLISNVIKDYLNVDRVDVLHKDEFAIVWFLITNIDYTKSLISLNYSDMSKSPIEILNLISTQYLIYNRTIKEGA